MTEHRVQMLPWSSPLCSHCDEPIAHPEDGMATWHEDDYGRVYQPGLFHVGSICGYYRGRVPVTLRDIGIQSFRLSPMDAVLVALKSRMTVEGKCDDCARLEWGLWVSCILGAPYNAWNCISALGINGEVADRMYDRVAIKCNTGCRRSPPM